MEQQNAGGLSRRAKQNEEDILALIATREQSGLSVKAFCERHALSVGTYYYWQKKYRDKNKAAAGPKQGGFAVLQLQDAGSIPGSLSGELILPNGIRLRLYQPVTASFVQSLL